MKSLKWYVEYDKMDGQFMWMRWFSTKEEAEAFAEEQEAPTNMGWMVEVE